MWLVEKASAVFLSDTTYDFQLAEPLFGTKCNRDFQVDSFDLGSKQPPRTP